MVAPAAIPRLAGATGSTGFIERMTSSTFLANLEGFFPRLHVVSKSSAQDTCLAPTSKLVAVASRSSSHSF